MAAVTTFAYFRGKTRGAEQRASTIPARRPESRTNSRGSCRSRRRARKDSSGGTCSAAALRAPPRAAATLRRHPTTKHSRSDRMNVNPFMHPTSRLQCLYPHVKGVEGTGKSRMTHQPLYRQTTETGSAACQFETSLQSVELVGSPLTSHLCSYPFYSLETRIKHDSTL